MLRVGGDGWEFGEPYEIAMVCVNRGDGVCELQGIDRQVSPSQWRAIRECLQEAGFHTVRYERHRDDGTVDWRTIDIAVKEWKVRTATGW